MNTNDEMTVNPSDLLAQYRNICEVIGAARAKHATVSRDLAEQLSRIEAELQTRLWLAQASTPTRGKRQEPQQKQAPTHDPTPAKAPQADAQSQGTQGAQGTQGTQGALGAQGARAEVFCDGSCSGNPGPGGYGAIVRIAGQPDRQLSGGKPHTTNNEMELSGAIAGLSLAMSLGASTIKVQSDSEYMIKGITKWIVGWQRNGWKTSSGGAVKNRALWEELSKLCANRSVTWSWIRGHAGHAENERCDDLAVAAAKQQARHRTS